MNGLLDRDPFANVTREDDPIAELLERFEQQAEQRHREDLAPTPPPCLYTDAGGVSVAWPKHDW